MLNLKERALRLIAEPAAGSKAVIDRRSTGTILYKGFESATTYVCGSCGSPLLVGLDVRKFHDVVFKCNHCKSFNVVEWVPVTDEVEDLDEALESEV